MATFASTPKIALCVWAVSYAISANWALSGSGITAQSANERALLSSGAIIKKSDDKTDDPSFVLTICKAARTT